MASSISIQPGSVDKVAPTNTTASASARLVNIDALRGFVMVLMLLDHLRETWFVNYMVTDPINASTILPAIGFARFAVSFCAPIFVALTGLGVYLFSINHTVEETTSYLLKRGFLLIAIELVYLSPLYWGIVPQPTFWLQVIWAIGLCMIALALLMRLPRPALIGFGLTVVCFHNFLDPIRLTQDDTLFPLWAMLHQRDVIELPFGFVAKTTYPILPWLGVISLGFGIGNWFRPDVLPETRQRRLQLLGFGMIAAFILLRLLNVYGDKPWYVVDGDPVRTIIGFISLTKYPPSLLFLVANARRRCAVACPVRTDQDFATDRRPGGFWWCSILLLPSPPNCPAYSLSQRASDLGAEQWRGLYVRQLQLGFCLVYRADRAALPADGLVCAA